MRKWDSFAIVRAVRPIARRYRRARPVRSAAAISFYLVLSVFPFLICVNGLLHFFHIEYPDLWTEVSAQLPESVRTVLTEYASYVQAESSVPLQIAGAVLLISAGSGAARAALRAIGDIRGGSRYSAVGEWVFGLLFAGLLPIAWVIDLMLSLFGASAVRWGAAHGWLTLPQSWISVGRVALYGFLFGMLAVLYGISARKKPVAPGAFVGTAGIGVIGAVYARLIQMSARYSLVYGSLAAMMMLMMWSNACNRMILLGAAVNGALGDRKKGEYHVSALGTDDGDSFVNDSRHL